MSIKEQPSPELGIKSLTTAAARPCAFIAYTNNTHFDKSTENVNVFRFYCILTVCFAGDVEIQRIRGLRYWVWGTGGRDRRFCGCCLHFQGKFHWKQKNNAILIINVVLLEEVNVDVMPDDKLIVYHMKAYMDHRISDWSDPKTLGWCVSVSSQTSCAVITLCERRAD